MDFRQMTPEAVAALAEKMKDPRTRMQAAVKLAEEVGPSPDMIQQQQQGSQMAGMMNPQQGAPQQPAAAQPAPAPAPAPMLPVGPARVPGGSADQYFKLSGM